jgi:predicted Kef-type K+ transport protein
LEEPIDELFYDGLGMATLTANTGEIRPGMAIIVGIPPLSRRARLPAVVGLLLCGVVIGPHVLGFFGETSGQWRSEFYHLSVVIVPPGNSAFKFKVVDAEEFGLHRVGKIKPI